MLTEWVKSKVGVLLEHISVWTGHAHVLSVAVLVGAALEQWLEKPFA